MDPEEKRVRELMADLNRFCFSHNPIRDSCEKCPFHKYEACPVADFHYKCLLAIYNKEEYSL